MMVDPPHLIAMEAHHHHLALVVIAQVALQAPPAIIRYWFKQMQSTIKLLQRTLAVLCLYMHLLMFFLPYSSMYLWQTITKNPCYNSGRMYLEGDNNCKPIELEISRGQSGIFVYFNSFLYQFPPLDQCPEKSILTLLVKETTLLQFTQTF